MNHLTRKRLDNILEKSYNYSWANQCRGEENEFHDKNRRTSNFRFVGQNYASKFHSANLGEKFLEDMIQDLYDEVLAEKIYKPWFHIDIDHSAKYFKLYFVNPKSFFKLIKGKRFSTRKYISV